MTDKDEQRRAQRNLNPTPEARVAMIIWGKEYSEQRGGSMDFWDNLDDDRKRRCAFVVEALTRTEAATEAYRRAMREAADIAENAEFLGHRGPWGLHIAMMLRAKAADDTAGG